MRLHVLEQGSIQAVDNQFVTETGETILVTATWPVRCYLIQHDTGWLLWDTGLPEAELAANPFALGGDRKVVLNPVWPWLRGFGIERPNQLIVGLSHLHIDHGGNVCQFTGARFLIGRREVEHALRDNVTRPYFPPGYANLAGESVQKIDDRFDVFGDGSAVIHAAPGHAPGHQILLLRRTDKRPIMLVGDAGYSPVDFAERRCAAWNFNRAQSFRTMDALERLANETGARLVFHHDPAADHD